MGTPVSSAACGGAVRTLFALAALVWASMATCVVAQAAAPPAAMVALPPLVAEGVALAKLQGPDAVQAARTLAQSDAAALQLAPRELADLVSGAIPLLSAQGTDADVEAAHLRRLALTLQGPHGETLARDVLWADRQEAFAAWLASRGRFREAVDAQSEAVAAYRALLGISSPGLADHLALLVKWDDQAHTLPNHEAAANEALALQASLQATLSSPLVALGVAAPPITAPGEQRVRRVRVYFATDRAETPFGTGDDLFYGYEAAALSYGYIDLQVPARPNPVSGRDGAYRIEVTPDRLNATVALGRVKLSRDDALTQAAAQARGGGGEILIYVHGFRNSFMDAARVAANLHVDLDVRGATVFYSWPAQYSVFGYPRDEALAEDAQANRGERLRQLIADLARASPGSRIFLVAHSMGNRIAIEALAKLVRQAGQPPLVQHALLASPDLAVPRLVQLATTIQANSGTVTLYASDRDQALFASHLIHLCDSLFTVYVCPRAGRSRTIPPGILGEKVDTSFAPFEAAGLGGDWLGHDDFMRSGLTDMRAVLWAGMPIKSRCYLKPSAGYYYFLPSQCELPAFADALAVRRAAPSRIDALAKAQEKIVGATSPSEQAHWSAVRRLIDGWS